MCATGGWLGSDCEYARRSLRCCCRGPCQVRVAERRCLDLLLAVRPLLTSSRQDRRCSRGRRCPRVQCRKPCSKAVIAVRRPPVAMERMALTTSGQVRCSLKSPYPNATYQGVFAPHSKLRMTVRPAGRGKGKKPQTEAGAEPSSSSRYVAMSWAQRLKRVCGVGIKARACPDSGQERGRADSPGVGSGVLTLPDRQEHLTKPAGNMT
jgi:hypothetical protein